MNFYAVASQESAALDASLGAHETGCRDPRSRAANSPTCGLRAYAAGVWYLSGFLGVSSAIRPTRPINRNRTCTFVTQSSAPELAQVDREYVRGATFAGCANLSLPLGAGSRPSGGQEVAGSNRPRSQSVSPSSSRSEEPFFVCSGPGDPCLREAATFCSGG